MGCRLTSVSVSDGARKYSALRNVAYCGKSVRSCQARPIWDWCAHVAIAALRDGPQKAREAVVVLVQVAGRLEIVDAVVIDGSITVAARSSTCQRAFRSGVTRCPRKQQLLLASNACGITGHLYPDRDPDPRHTPAPAPSAGCGPYNTWGVTAVDSAGGDGGAPTGVSSRGPRGGAAWLLRLHSAAGHHVTSAGSWEGDSNVD